MKKILTFILAVLMIMGCCMFTVSAEEAVTYNPEDLEKIIAERLDLGYPENPDLADVYEYKKIYEYYSTPEESIPDYILVFAANPFVSPAIYREYIGEYIAVSYNYYYPYNLGLFIYVPAKDQIYTLKEAYEKGVNGIEKVFTEADIMCGVLGDADKDGRLTVKDATWIQKTVAGIKMQTPYNKDILVEGLLDFNKDYEINIKDATAIQKYVAGIIE